MKKIILLLAVIFSLSSCSSLQKKHFKAQSFYKENKELLAEICAAEFPSETHYIKGESIVSRDTTYIDVPFLIDCDSVISNNKGGHNVVRKTVRKEVVKEIETRTDTVFKPNTAKEYVLNSRINELQANNVLLSIEKEKLLNDVKLLNKENKRLKIAAMLLGVFILGLGYITFKK